MKPFQNVDGSVLKSTRIYDIAPDEQIEAGQVVVLTGGKVKPAAAGQTTAILGIAAERHGGNDDALNPRNNGKEISVYDSPGLLMQQPAPKYAATGGSATTYVCTDLAEFADDDFKGGYIRLVSKGEESTNTDGIGTVREITASAGSSKTLTVEEGGTICAGDVYEIYPPIGFQKGNLSADGTSLVLTATATLALKVVQNVRNGNICLMAALHALAN